LTTREFFKNKIEKKRRLDRWVKQLGLKSLKGL
jgi:hypothetical protein